MEWVMSALAAVCDGPAGCWLDPQKAQGDRDLRRCLFYFALKLIVDRKKSIPLGKSCKVVGIGAIEGADGGALAGEGDGGGDEGGPREAQGAREGHGPHAGPTLGALLLRLFFMTLKPRVE